MSDDTKKPQKPLGVHQKPRPTSGTPVMRWLDSNKPRSTGSTTGVQGSVRSDTGTRRPDTGSGTKREKDK